MYKEEVCIVLVLGERVSYAATMHRVGKLSKHCLNVMQ